MTLSSVSYKRHRFPPAIIAHAVWIYFRFPLSLRLVEKMLLERGIVVSYETVRGTSADDISLLILSTDLPSARPTKRDARYIHLVYKTS